MTDDRDRRCSPAFPGRKGASDLRPDAEHVEIVRRYEGGPEGTRFGQGHRHVGVGNAAQTFETGHPLIEHANDVRVVRQCCPGSRRSPKAEGFQDLELYETILILDPWKRRTEQRAVDERERDDRRRQAQAEIPDDRGGEPRCPAEAAHGEPDVSEDAFQTGASPCLPNMLLDLLDATQLDEGRAPCVLRGHARADLRFGVVLDERAELLTEL